MDIVKSICLGADMVGIRWRDTKNIIEDGYDKANKYMKDLNYKLKLLMLLTGSKNIEDLKKRHPIG